MPAKRVEAERVEAEKTKEEKLEAHRLEEDARQSQKDTEEALARHQRFVDLISKVGEENQEKAVRMEAARPKEETLEAERLKTKSKTEATVQNMRDVISMRDRLGVAEAEADRLAQIGADRQAAAELEAEKLQPERRYVLGG